MVSIHFAITSAVVGAMLFGVWCSWLGYLVGRSVERNAALAETETGFKKKEINQ